MTTPTLLLHHYPISPYAEKIRAILGFKGLAWQSVHQPNIMPKPDLQALTGGYRRIPVLQVGSDLVCDSALIADVLDQLAPSPALVPAHAKGVARIVAQWADTTLFVAAMGHNFSPTGAQHIFKDAPPDALKAFATDRQAMRGGAPRMAPGDATGAYKSHLRRLASMLKTHGFLLGDTPTLADFAAYGPLWFTWKIATPLADVLDATPEIMPWLERMSALGHGQMGKSSATHAIAVASMDSLANPAFPLKTDAAQLWASEHGLVRGDWVDIAAESFGVETTRGRLVASTRTRLSIERESTNGALVRVHFPKVGYVVKAAPA